MCGRLMMLIALHGVSGLDNPALRFEPAGANPILRGEWIAQGGRVVEDDSDSFDFLWIGHQGPVSTTLGGGQIINRVPGMSLLSRKESLGAAAKVLRWPFVPFTTKSSL